MTDPEAPVRRGPGRPRKAPTVKPQVAVNEAPVDAWKTPEPAQFPPDERIGQPAALGCVAIAFPDGRQYRIENGVIVERVH